MAREKNRAPDTAPGQPFTGWIQWGGGPCPVGAEVQVEITCRDGFSLTGCAGDFASDRNDGQDWWLHGDERPVGMANCGQCEDDIVRYRLVSA